MAVTGGGVGGEAEGVASAALGVEVPVAVELAVDGRV